MSIVGLGLAPLTKPAPARTPTFTAPVKPTQFQLLHAAPSNNAVVNWWNGQSTAIKIAIVGGGVAALGAVAYLLMGSSSSATPNPLSSILGLAGYYNPGHSPRRMPRNRRRKSRR